MLSILWIKSIIYFPDTDRYLSAVDILKTLSYNRLREYGSSTSCCPPAPWYIYAVEWAARAITNLRKYIVRRFTLNLRKHILSAAIPSSEERQVYCQPFSGLRYIDPVTGISVAISSDIVSHLAIKTNKCLRISTKLCQAEEICSLQLLQSPPPVVISVDMFYR